MSPEVQESLDRIGIEVAEEIRVAIEGHSPDFASAHEAFGVLLEEVEEFKACVWQKRAHRNKVEMIRELTQVAAVVIKYAAQLQRERARGA